MPKYDHRRDPVGRIDHSLGRLHFLEPNHDNTAHICVYTDEAETEMVFVHGGQEVARRRYLDCEHWALSYDGRQLAVTRGRRRQGEPSEIYLNGQLAYTVPHDTLSRLAWLDNDRLVWDAWDRDIRTNGIHCYLNGQEVTDWLNFECYGTAEGRQLLAVRENGQVYRIDDSGRRFGLEPAIFMDDGRFCLDHHEFCRRLDSEDDRRATEMARSGIRPDPLPPEADARGMSLRDLMLYGLLQEMDGRQVTWRGQAGPEFDGLESGSGLRTYAVSDDGRHLGYVGIRYASWARSMMGPVGRAIKAASEREDDSGRAPWWGWVLALLFNPYMGVGYAASEASRRWYPVKDNRAWKKGYEFANGQFFAPTGELVVTCRSGCKEMVVVDEDEGPAFDQVWNVRCLDDGRLCYLARRDDTVFRVTVQLNPAAE